MSITQDDFKKIWASTSSVPEYTFSDSDYQDGWEFVGNLPPTRAMWDTLQRRNDQKMKFLQDNGSMCFDSVADMVSTDLEAGQTALTKGYHSVNDGGSALYTIRAKDVADVDDGGSIIFLENGNVAELIPDGTFVNVKQFGAYGDGTHEDTTAVQNALNFNNYVYFPQGTYLLRTVNITRDTKVFTDVGAIVKLDYGDPDVVRPYYTVFNFSNCTLKVDGFTFVGQVKTFAYGTFKESIFKGNVGTLDIENCVFDTVQVTGAPSAETALADRDGSIATTLDCNIIAKNLKFINCKNRELFMCNSTESSIDDVTIDAELDNIYMNGCNYSWNIVARNITAKNIHGDHSSYGGSAYNLFGLKNMLIENVDIVGSASVFDTSEGGLFRCENVVVRNCETKITIVADTTTAFDSKVSCGVINTQDADFSPLTVKNRIDVFTVNCERCDYRAGTSGTGAVAPNDVYLNFDKCTFAEEYVATVPYDSSDHNRVHCTVLNSNVKCPQFNRGVNRFANCIVDSQTWTGTAYAFGGRGTYLIGCTCTSAINPYGGSLYCTLLACDNITNP